MTDSLFLYLPCAATLIFVPRFLLKCLSLLAAVLPRAQPRRVPGAGGPGGLGAPVWAGGGRLHLRHPRRGRGRGGRVVRAQDGVARRRDQRQRVGARGLPAPLRPLGPFVYAPPQLTRPGRVSARQPSQRPRDLGAASPDPHPALSH